ncbi:MAG TPA: proline dehydrogenase family protein [Bdellovibrionota bacterium]|nr:proline dehydrogenase family protein [Bdellovibrionota bacterium]
MGTLSFLARRFVAGETLEEGIDAVRTLNVGGVMATLDVLGENVSNEREVEAAAASYIELLRAIGRAKIQSNVSLKLTQMGLDIGEDYCLGVMRRIVAEAMQHNNFVRIDMEGSAYTERTLHLFQELYSKFPNGVGIVLQSYLHRSEEDARKMALLRAPVRVCKGAYKEPTSIAYQDMDDIRRSYRSMVEVLLKGGSHVGIATHDERLLRWVVEWTGKENVPRSQFEFQMLYGLRRKRARELASQGYAVRSYVPFGTHWLPYFVRRLRERKENIFFVLKSLVTD